MGQHVSHKFIDGEMYMLYQVAQKFREVSVMLNDVIPKKFSFLSVNDDGTFAPIKGGGGGGGGCSREDWGGKLGVGVSFFLGVVDFTILYPP